MKRYCVPWVRLRDWPHPHPDRTAYKPAGGHLNFDYLCAVWTSRGAMLQACKMSDTGEFGNKPWKPLIQS